MACFFEKELNLNDILPPKTNAAEAVTPASDDDSSSDSLAVKKTKVRDQRLRVQVDFGGLT